MQKYFTTPIYYVNDKPHIGSAYCTLATDTIARYWKKKLGKDQVFFLTGTDENSQKTLEAAEKNNQSVSDYLEEIAQHWKETWQSIGIEFDDFIRTTEPRHQQTVKTVFEKIYAAGDIYQGTYNGLYCHGCEAFLKKSDLDENGHCPAHRRAPVELAEKNYFFRLSKFQQPLLDWYAEDPSRLEPAERRNEVLAFIKRGLEDVSISRETAEIGIPLPIDEQHKVYVWFDALINYLSATQNPKRASFWGSAEHVIGKDITRFHAIIWPAMLMSAGYDLPRKIFVHGFFTINGQKMSKSLANVVHPITLCEKYGPDALRIGLLSSLEFGNDGDFSAENFQNFYRTRLMGGVGNLFQRVLTLGNRFFAEVELESIYDPAIAQTTQKFEQAMESYQLWGASQQLFSLVDQANALLNETQPWKLVKTDSEAAQKVVQRLLGFLETIADLSVVWLPHKAPEMRAMLEHPEQWGSPKVLFAPPVE